MRFNTVALTLAAVASVASAWDFTGWHLQNYKGDLVIQRSGGVTTNNQCVDIVKNDDTMSSFKWSKRWFEACRMKLFDGHGCKGEVLASADESWNVPAISKVHDNRVSSLWVDCI